MMSIPRTQVLRALGQLQPASVNSAQSCMTHEGCIEEENSTGPPATHKVRRVERQDSEHDVGGHECHT